MTTTEATTFTSNAPVPAAPKLEVKFRRGRPEDQSYILGCWSRSWARSLDCRWMNRGKFHKHFQDVIAGGVMNQADTKVLVGCSPDDMSWIWCFCVFTPAYEQEDPTIHWINVRPTLRSGDAKRNLLRIGLATRMLAVGPGKNGYPDGPGVRDRLTYTCRPGLMTAGHLKQPSARLSWETDEQYLNRIDTEKEADEQTELRRLEGDLHAAGRKAGIAMRYEPITRWLRGGG